MPFHDSYHLILSAPETRHTFEDNTSPHLLLEHAVDTSKRSSSKAVCQIPKWVYQNQNGIDQVKLEVPGINMDNVALFVSKRDLVVSAMRYSNSGSTRTVHCEYFFKMRLADDSDPDSVSSNYRNGMLTILLPRVENMVKNLIPAFVYNGNSDRDEVMLELAGVKDKDVKYDIKDQTITIRAPRYDECDELRSLAAEYVFKIKAASDSDLKQVFGNLSSGVFTLCIPRKQENEHEIVPVQEAVPVYYHKQKPGVDIIIIELPGVNEDGIKIRALSKQLCVQAKKFDDEGDQRVLRTMYMFYKDLSTKNDINAMTSKFDMGVLTLSIPRNAVDHTKTSNAPNRI